MLHMSHEHAIVLASQSFIDGFYTPRLVPQRCLAETAGAVATGETAGAVILLHAAGAAAVGDVVGGPVAVWAGLGVTVLAARRVVHCLKFSSRILKTRIS